MVTQVSRGRLDRRVNLESLDWLDNLAFQVLMDQKEKGESMDFLVSQVQRVLMVTLESKGSWEAEDFQEKRVTMAPQVHLDQLFSLKETLASQEFKVYLDLRAQQGPMDRKDNKV